MAKAKTSTPEDASAKPEVKPIVSALHSEAGRTWLASELEKADREVSHGPRGQGWTHNEALRPQIEERAEFLRALYTIATA